MKKQLQANRSKKEREKELRRFARVAGVSIKQARELDERLRAMPMERFLDALFGSGNWFYDPSAHLWIGPNSNHQGQGFGFMAIREDKSYFCGVIPQGAFQ
jgi:hypothetical protein